MDDLQLFVANTSIAELKLLNCHDIALFLTKKEFMEFMFIKNIKILGGINEYIDDWINTFEHHIEQFDSNTAKLILNRMLIDENISDKNKNKVIHSLSLIL